MALPTVSQSELTTAIRAVEKEQKITLDDDLAYSFILKVADKKDGHPFPEALRFALNDLHVRDREKRKFYCKVAGKYYGRRGGLKRSKTSSGRHNSKKQREQKPATQTQLDEKTGQYSFVI